MKSAVVVGALGGFVLAVAMHDVERARGCQMLRASMLGPGARGGPPPAPSVVAPFFGNETCPLDGKPTDRTSCLQHDGQRVYACSAACAGRLAGEPASALERAYPGLRADSIDACIVCAAPIDRAARAPSSFQGRSIHLCGDDCERHFRRLPVVWLTRDRWPDVHDAGNNLCPVDDRPIDGVTVVLYRSILVRLSGPDCVAAFVEEPELMLARVRREKG